MSIKIFNIHQVKMDINSGRFGMPSKEHSSQKAQFSKELTQETDRLSSKNKETLENHQHQFGPAEVGRRTNEEYTRHKCIFPGCEEYQYISLPTDKSLSCNHQNHWREWKLDRKLKTTTKNGRELITNMVHICNNCRHWISIPIDYTVLTPEKNEVQMHYDYNKDVFTNQKNLTDIKRTLNLTKKD